MHTTSATLLERLRGPADQAAWERFVQLYTPLLLAWAGRVGLRDQDAADIVQDVFAVLVQKLPEFQRDPSKSFRGWLRTIVMNKWHDRLRRDKLAVQGQGEKILAAQAAPEDVPFFEEQEYRQFLVNRALALMRSEFQPNSWQACWEHVANGRSAPEVGKELGMSDTAVYSATSRVMRRLREALDGLVE